MAESARWPDRDGESTEKSENVWNIGTFTQILGRALHTGILGDLLGKLEQEKKIKRINLAFGLLTVLAVYLAFGARAHFICTFITVVIPAWIVVKSIEERYPVEELKEKWLSYWITYNGFQLMEYLYLDGDPKMPYHWLLKTVFLVLCFTPPWNLSEKIYHHLISPYYHSMKEIIEENITEVKAAWRDPKKGLFRASVWFFITLAMYYSPYSVFELLCNCIGFIYPAYVSLIAMQNPEGSADWIVYWIIYSAIGAAEFVHHIFWIPLYWIVKLIVLVSYLNLQKKQPGKSFERFCHVLLRNMPLTRIACTWSQWARSVITAPSASPSLQPETAAVTSENEKMLCKICLTNELSITFVPCGHLACCTDCAAEMTSCPICRAPVRSIVRTYLS